MSTQQDKIYFGFFRDFEKPTLLFFGTPTAFSTFKGWLLKCAETEETSVRLSEVSLFAMGNVDVVVRVVPKSTGMKQVDNHTFEWGVSPETCQVFAGYLDPLAESNVAAHQYLECDALDDVVVVASVDEYSVEFFKAHGDNMWEANS